MIVSEDGGIALKAAKDIVIGDEVWSITWGDFANETLDPLAIVEYSELENHRRVRGTIVSIEESSKASTVTINNDSKARFTLGEKLLVQRDNKVMFLEVQDLKIDDMIFSVSEKAMEGIRVASMEVIDQARTVYKFNVSPVDTLIAGGLVVHNSKV